MAIPGTLTYEGANPITQGQYDEIPTVEASHSWLRERVEEDVNHICRVVNSDEAGYEPGMVWFTCTGTDAPSDLSGFGFDLYDQGSDKWFAYLPDDRTVA